MRGAICLMLALSAAGLKVKSDDVKPKYFKPEGGTGIAWQRPAGEVKGLVLYLHGCHNYATDMFSTVGRDGYRLKFCGSEATTPCRAHREEMLARKKSRKKGYIFAAVQGGTDNPRGCTNSLDIPKIKKSLKYLKAQENLIGKPIILMGMSAGARTVPELVAKGTTGAQCSVIVANEVRVKGDSQAPVGIPEGYPKDVPAFFVHMPHDDARINNVNKNLRQFKRAGVKTGEIQVKWGPKHFMAAGAYMNDIIDWCESNKVSESKPPAEELNVQAYPEEEQDTNSTQVAKSIP